MAGSYSGPATLVAAADPPSHTLPAELQSCKIHFWSMYAKTLNSGAGCRVLESHTFRYLHARDIDLPRGLRLYE